MVISLIYGIIYFLLLLIFIVDIKHKIIPNIFNLALFFLVLVLGKVELNLQERLLGSAIYTLPFLFIFAYGSDFFNKECLGVGDLKLMMSLGGILKFTNFLDVLLFLNIAFTLPFTYIIFRFIIKKKLDKEIAFAPFLILAFIFSLYLQQ